MKQVSPCVLLIMILDIDIVKVNEPRAIDLCNGDVHNPMPTLFIELKDRSATQTVEIESNRTARTSI